MEQPTEPKRPSTRRRKPSAPATTPESPAAAHALEPGARDAPWPESGSRLADFERQFAAYRATRSSAPRPVAVELNGTPSADSTARTRLAAVAAVGVASAKRRTRPDPARSTAPRPASATAAGARDFVLRRPWAAVAAVALYAENALRPEQDASTLLLLLLAPVVVVACFCLFVLGAWALEQTRVRTIALAAICVLLVASIVTAHFEGVIVAVALLVGGVHAGAGARRDRPRAPIRPPR